MTGVPHTHTSARLPAFPLRADRESQPPEPHVDDQHDEKHSHGRELGVGGTHVQVLGVLAVLLGQAGQVVGLGIESCRRERAEEGQINPTR